MSFRRPGGWDRMTPPRAAAGRSCARPRRAPAPHFDAFAADLRPCGHRHAVDSAPDMIASTANNLKTDGWVPGESWGYEVVLPPGFDYLLADRSKKMTIAQWEGLGGKR